MSVVIAAYQAAATVGASIDSLLAQDGVDVEILVGDDASDDGTAEVLAARFGDEPRVRRFTSRRNQGAYNLRNALAAHARGTYLTFHDADDLAVPGRLLAQVDALVATGARASYGCMFRITADGRAVFFRDGAALRLAMVTLLTTPEEFRSLGGFRPARFGADLELHETLRHRHGDRAIEIVRQPLMLGLWAAGSATRQRDAEALEDGYRAPARRRYVELLARRWLDGDPPAWSERLDRALRADGNYQEPSTIDPA
ncbi:MAG: glycosyltransferase family A protein [Kofleriaceae bacterium]